MDRISDLERKYVMEALDNGFRASRRHVFNQRLEEACCKRFNVNFAIALTNGTCTLHSALAALGIGPGDEVIVPALTMSSPALSVLQCGAIPVFADVSTDNFTLNPISVRQCITQRTKAIISVSLYGLPPDYDAILKICQQHSLFLIEDNALCFSGKYQNKTVGGFGHFASYSFQGSKQLTCGEGGILLTNDAALAEKARRFSRLGFNGITATGTTLTKYQIQHPGVDRHLSMGFNYKMSELCAAVALAQVERADELTMQRKAVAELYHKAISDCQYLFPQKGSYPAENDYWSFAMVLNTKKPETDWFRFRDLFKNNGGDGFYAAWKLSYNEPMLQCQVQYTKGVWQQYNPKLCINAERLQPRIIQLKTNYWDLKEARRQATILHKTINEFTC